MDYNDFVGILYLRRSKFKSFTANLKMDKNGIIRTRPEGPRDYNTPKGQNRRSGPKYKHYFL
jgi:hypothetical protein